LKSGRDLIEDPFVLVTNPKIPIGKLLVPSLVIE
jgi:hypothetical protein